VSGQLFSTEDWQVEFDELTRLVEEAVSLLPEKCREIFSRSRDKNLTNREIAEELGISVKTVEGQITIALKKIKAFLGDKYAYLW
jgi:RNA polymerase sigma-70 factor (ECF subfamily)